MSGFERAINLVLAIAAVAIAATFVYREVRAGNQPNSGALARDDRAVFIKDWRNLQDAGIEVGDSAAPIKVIEFADFECPFCKRFDSTMQIVSAKYPKTVSLVFIHLPLSMHRFARPAARAAECAANQGRFSQFHHALYAKQDSLGLKSWTSYALESDVSDTTQFARCVARTDPVPRIEAGVKLAAKLGLRATPTVIVNGWEFPAPPNDSVLSETVDALMAGKEPPAAAHP